MAWFRGDDYKEEYGHPALERSLPLGLLAMAPLWFAYEFAQGQTSGGLRNASEVILTQPLRPVETASGWALVTWRRTLLAGLMLWSLLHCLRRRLELVPMVLRVVFEGVLGALTMGPLLVFLIGRLGQALPPLPKLGEHAVGDTTFTLHALGGAAWEELLFRVLLFPLLFLVIRELFQFAGWGAARSVDDDEEAGVRAWWGRAGRGSAELLAAILSSLAFAGYHVTHALAPLGIGGEPFRPALFVYRFLAGMLLVAIFRWRGPGVAAWSHGVFNLALCLGAGPAVFQ